MRHLIVNADDFNTDKERSLGILACARKGILTSTTILANLAWEEETLSELLSLSQLACGCHLNLTKGKPITAGPSLVDQDGSFFAKELAWDRALCGEYDLQEVKDEFVAQIENCLAQGLKLHHVDGNNHIHIFPGICDVVPEVLVKYSIKAVRVPRENPIDGRIESTKQELINSLTAEALSVFRQAELVFTDFFFGIEYPPLNNVASLLHFIESLPHGFTELMCHPGFVGAPDNPFSTKERENELRTLCHADVRQAIKDSGVELTTYEALVKG